MLHLILRFVSLLRFIIKKHVSDRQATTILFVERSVCWRVGPKSVGLIICPRRLGVRLHFLKNLDYPLSRYKTVLTYGMNFKHVSFLIKKQTV